MISLKKKRTFVEKGQSTFGDPFISSIRQELLRIKKLLKCSYLPYSVKILKKKSSNELRQYINQCRVVKC